MKKRTVGSGPLTKDELGFIQTLVDDKWPLREIRYTYGVSNRLMIKHFPEYRGLDPKTSGSLGRAAGRANKKKDLVSV
jgi:Uncharacterized protein involved in propionate catabolism